MEIYPQNFELSRLKVVLGPDGNVASHPQITLPDTIKTFLKGNKGATLIIEKTSGVIGATFLKKRKK